MLKKGRWFAAWLAPVAIVVIVIGVAQSLRVPVPSAEYRDCLESAQKANNKHPQCSAYETIWERGLGDPVAYYTLWLTLFTGALASVGIVQGILFWQQIKLAREEFHATHRPRIITRSFESCRIDDTHYGVNFTFVNVGDTDATIEEIGVCVSENSDPGKVIERVTRQFPIHLVSGDKDRHCITDGRISFANMGKLGRYLQPDFTLYVMGRIKYSDALGRRRETGFCRKFNAENGRWVRQSQSEYEYID